MEQSSKSTFSCGAPLAAILIIAGALRLYQLDLRSLWLDEATSLTVAQHSLADIVGGRAFNNHTPPMYYILLHLWLKLLPPTEWGMRLLSAVLDTINSALVFTVFSRQYSRRVGFTAALIYATSPFVIYYAQEARMYPWVIFLALLAYGYAIRMLERPAAGIWQLGLFVVAVLGLYSHYFYAFFLASVTCALLASFRRAPRQILLWLGPVLCAGICFLPWVKIVLELAAGPGQTFRQFVLSVPPYAFFRFVAGYAVMPLMYGLKENMRETLSLWLPVIGPFLIVFGALTLFGLKRAVKAPHALLLLSALLGPALVSLALAAKTNILSERYWSISYPYFVAVLALLPWGTFRPRWWLAGELVAAALWCAALISHYTNPAFGFADWRSAARIAEETKGGLAVIHPDFNRDVFQFYYGTERPVVVVTDDEIFSTTLAKIQAALPNADSPLILVESGNVNSLEPLLLQSGYRKDTVQLLVFENGIRVVTFVKAG